MKHGNSSLIVQIDGRDALPVRSIPYVTGWRWPSGISPYALALNLGRHPKARHPFDILRTTTAYKLSFGKAVEVRPGEWNMVAVQMAGFSSELMEQFINDDQGYAAWQARAGEKLPSGVYVLLDEFEKDFHRNFDEQVRGAGVETLCDHDLNLAPMLLSDEVRKMVLEGFEVINTIKSIVEDVPLTAATSDVIDAATAEVSPVPILTAVSQDQLPSVSPTPAVHDVEDVQPAAASLDGILKLPAVKMSTGELIQLAIPKYIAATWEESMDASSWWKNESISPIHAALILSGHNPNKGADASMIEAAEKTTNEGIRPDQFRALKNKFEGASKKEPRTLKDWMDYAQQHGEKIHSWIDEWLQAGGAPLPVSPPQATPASGSGWMLKKPKRYQGYGKPLYDMMKAAHAAGSPRPTALNVLDVFAKNKPLGIISVTSNTIDYENGKGEKGTADLDAIRKAIGRLVFK